jgi:hypothetical protein
VFGGVSLGVTNNDSDTAVSGVVGAWSAVSYPTVCAMQHQVLASVAVGIRWLGGVTELYVTPKAGVLVGGC